MKFSILLSLIENALISAISSLEAEMLLLSGEDSFCGESIHVFLMYYFIKCNAVIKFANIKST